MPKEDHLLCSVTTYMSNATLRYIVFFMLCVVACVLKCFEKEKSGTNQMSYY